MDIDKKEDGPVAPVATDTTTIIVDDDTNTPEVEAEAGSSLVVPKEEPSAAVAPKEVVPVAENRLAPFNPTSDQAQQTALRLLNLSKVDVLFDLGCGDGRLLITAVNNKHTEGLRCVGIEMDPVFTSRAVTSIQQLAATTQQRIEIREGDVLELGYQDSTESAPQQQSTTAATAENNLLGETGKSLCQHLTLLNDATAVYLFLVPDGLKQIKPLLDRVVEIRKQQKRPFSVVAYMFQVHGWEPLQVDRTTKGEMPLYLYRFEA
jgi:hypothetical protein